MTLKMTGVIHPLAMMNPKNEVAYLMGDCTGVFAHDDVGDVVWDEIFGPED